MINFYRKPILLFSAVGNIMAGVMAIALPAFHFEQMFAILPSEEALFPYVMMYHYAFWAIVIIMGIAYWMTARTPHDNRAVLFLGGTGKLACALVWLCFFATGHGNWLMIAGAGYDGILGVLFLLLSKSQRDNQQVSH